MNITLFNSTSPARGLPRVRALALRGPRAAVALKTSLYSAGISLFVASHAFAQATASTAGIGSQLQSTSQEASTTGGFLGSTAMYAAALICMIGGAWALWQGRQPQNREGGKMAMGIAGLVLAGLFATGGVWINKAANSVSGGNAVSSSTSGTVAFGAG